MHFFKVAFCCGELSFSGLAGPAVVETRFAYSLGKLRRQNLGELFHIDEISPINYTRCINYSTNTMMFLTFLMTV